jgi:hypothetical protein
MMQAVCNCGSGGHPYAHAETCPINPTWATTPPLDEDAVRKAHRAETLERLDEPAKRFDAGKARVDLIPPEFIEALGRHYAVGAAKYEENNWRKGMSWSRCYASAVRHLLAFWRGEEIDAETGTPHVIAAAWNMAALHWYGLHNAGTDDRPRFDLVRTEGGQA